MSYIPSHAMPHAYVHDEEDEENARRRRNADGQFSTALKVGGAALVGLLIYRVLR